MREGGKGRRDERGELHGQSQRVRRGREEVWEREGCAGGEGG